MRTAAKRRPLPNQAWCKKNVTTAEHDEFWKNWCQTQWGMPTFTDKRRFVEALRARRAA